MCDMLESVFCKREGADEVTDSPALFGKFVLDEVIAASGRSPFPELFFEISGRELSLDFLTQRLREEVSG